MKLFDVTRSIYPGMAVYEGDPSVAIERVSSVIHGAVNVSEVRLGTHTGTHVDPPLHVRDGARAVDELPLDVLIGPARVYAPDAVERLDLVALRGLDLTACPRVLFKTCAGGRVAAGAGLTEEAARALVAAGVRLVGVDSLSVDLSAAADLPAHRVLLAAGVIIVEGLDLALVPPGVYELLCLPLKLRGGDGAPARVVLRALD